MLSPLKLLIGLWAFALLPGAVDAHPQVELLRATVKIHRQLRRARVPLPLPPSGNISNGRAARTRYGDAWTCRRSTEKLIQKLGERRLPLKLHSVGRNTFHWGRHGWVDYHYFGVDRPHDPTLLVDPTSGPNFAKQARPGGLLHDLLRQQGARLGQRKAAERVARRVARGGVDGMLILAKPDEIAVYRAALEEAARLRRQSR